MDLKGSRTEQNLRKAFAGESQARNKYTFFASIAKKEGYIYVADVFEKFAENEKEHAKLWFKYLNSDSDTGTKKNLRDAIRGENFEWTSMYKEFAEVAEEEGFTEIAQKFKLAGQVEKVHEGQFEKCVKLLNEGSIFKRADEAIWICKNCGYIHRGKVAPEKCPLCEHPQGYFVIKT